MPICQNELCRVKFPFRLLIEGKLRSLKSRKFCTSCSPFGCRNTRKDINKPKRAKKDKRYFTCKICGKCRFQSGTNLECATCRGRRDRHTTRLRAVEHLGGKCNACGYNRCIEALDFHHLRDKLFTVATCWHWSWEKVESEINKCVLLCANCHRELHAKSRSEGNWHTSAA